MLRIRFILEAGPVFQETVIAAGPVMCEEGGALRRRQGLDELKN